MARSPSLLVAARALAGVVLCLAGLTPPAHALDPGQGLGECTVETWATSDGLPGAWIRSIAQSPDGYLWVGTQGGLVRYGGGALVHLRPPAVMEQASDVMGLQIGADGTVWLLPPRARPVCVRDGKLLDCLADAGLPPEIRHTALHVDSRGHVWLASSRGIQQLAAGKLTPVHAPAAYGNATVTALHRDRAGKLWVGTSAGLYIGEQTLSPQAHLGERITGPVTGLHENARGELWVATEHALYLFSESRAARHGVQEGLPSGRLTQVTEDRDGNVWIASRSGLLRLQPGRGPPVLFTRTHGLPDDDVSAVFEDREGSLWVGTRGGGLAQFTDRSLSTRHGPPTLRESWVSSVAEDDGGGLWVGSHLGVMLWKDGREHLYTEAHGLPSNQVRTVLPARDGNVWVGTDKGLGRWRQGRVDRPVAIEPAISSLHLEDDGTLWVGSDDGLWRVRADDAGQRWTRERLPLAPDLQGQRIGDIRSIGRDDAGVMWISAGGRLMKVEGGRLTREHPQNAPPFGRVRAIHRDSSGTLWLGTGDGLVRRRRGAWRIFSEAVGLQGADLFQVITDDSGYLWATAYRGILRISRSTLEDVAEGRRRQPEVVSFNASDQRRDVAALRPRQPAAWKTRDGALWFASGRGAVRVDPRRLRLNHLPPPVVIEEALVDGRRARRDGDNAFPPGSGALEFQYAAITLIEPRKTQYRYRLEGFDRDWIEAGGRRVAYYTNIGPGQYRFRVQGSNADGIWNEAGDSVVFSLAPHFFQRWWFYVLLALVVGALALSFHRMRLLQLRARYAATYAERTRVARELHDSLLQGMAGTLMRLRALGKRFTARVAQPPPADGVAEEIREIEQVVASNIEETRRFVWDLREEGASPPELGRALEELALRTVRSRSADARVVVEGPVAPVPAHVRHELLRVAHQALTNALEHGGARVIEVRLQYSTDAGLRLTVSDDGRGFDPQRAAGTDTGHFGLQGMRERAESLGRLSIESRPGGGTRVAIEVNRRELERYD